MELINIDFYIRPYSAVTTSDKREIVYKVERMTIQAINEVVWDQIIDYLWDDLWEKAHKKRI